ncbi:MAG: coniferyl aldehyde dehydrogenase [Burkholderiales bacterium]|nr:coniferyl aldehyde dehydrogenase [Burkholderiales bacterium]
MSANEAHCLPEAALFGAQRRAFENDRLPRWQQRRAHLETLARTLQRHGDVLAAAVDADFGGRSRHETALLELFPSHAAIRHARRHVRRWMRAQPRPVAWWSLPGRARVLWQPLGVVGIVVPWNYPIYLAVAPLASALAAGNRVLLKMPERVPRTSETFAAMIGAAFAADHVQVVLGDAEVARRFVALPFDHLLFTGSSAVGKQVMHAAAENLTPVTLELGGKSPAIVAPGYDIARAAERIMVGKCMNAGQTCIAPDYVLLPRGSEAQFTAAARAFVARAYPRLDANPDYSAIVDEGHYRRLASYVEEARGLGAEVVELAQVAAVSTARKMAPALVLGATDAMRIMRDEIFGPLLPLVPYDELNDALRYVNARARPLALYYFDSDGERIQSVLERTHAGGVTVNDTILHIAQDALPFGGVGQSGMGHYHGEAGFRTFSKSKGVFLQARVNAMGLLTPPYGKGFDRLLRWLLP